MLGASPTQGIVQAVFNAADANIKGAEVELTAIVVPGVTISGNYGYTDASYDTFVGVANPQDREFVRVPKHTFNASADYEHTRGNGDRINARATIAYTGRYFFDDPNLLSQTGYSLVDANFAYTFASKMTLAV